MRIVLVQRGEPVEAPAFAVSGVQLAAVVEIGGSGVKVRATVKVFARC